MSVNCIPASDSAFSTGSLVLSTKSAVIFSNSDATIGAQLYGIFAIGAFTIIASTLVWYVIKFTIGIRVTEEEELEGVDLAEIGMEAYPDFKK